MTTGFGRPWAGGWTVVLWRVVLLLTLCGGVRGDEPGGYLVVSGEGGVRWFPGVRRFSLSGNVGICEYANGKYGAIYGSPGFGSPRLPSGATRRGSSPMTGSGCLSSFPHSFRG